MSSGDPQTNGDSQNAAAGTPASAMSAESTPKKAGLNPDEAAALLRTAIRKRRSWSLSALALAMVFFGSPVAFLLWWFWPTSATSALDVVAFDQLTLPGIPATVSAALVPNDSESGTVSFTGREILFADPQSLRSGASSQQTRVGVDADGIATCQWPPAAGDSATEFEARFLDAERRHNSSSRARIFAWPQDTRLLFVEIEALTDGAPNFQDRDELVDLPVVKESALALQVARTRGFEVVYLATGPATAQGYRNVRDFWIERRAAETEEFRLPDGPVIGRPSYSGETSAAAAQREVIAQLKELYRGPFLVVAHHADTAAAFREAGIATIQIGEAGQSWQGVEKQLPK